MPDKLISEEVDIFELPSIDKVHQAAAGAQITTGDLHGNEVKLLFLLMKHGIATNIDEEKYARLVQIYKSSPLTAEELAEFNGILQEIEFIDCMLLRLIGDELADRGSNDYFTLQLLKKLHENDIPVEILASNHSYEFIEAYERKRKFISRRIVRGQVASMDNMNTLLESGLVEREEIMAIIDTHYKPMLRVISYSIDEEANTITLYSHARLEDGFLTLKQLAEQFDIAFKDATIAELKATIDNMNRVYQHHVQANTVHRLFKEGTPFFSILWSRAANSLPATHNGYNVNYVHGHEGKGIKRPNEDHVYNLDNQLGFYFDGEHYNKGTYTALYSQTTQIVPEEEPVDVSQPVEEDKDVSSLVLEEDYPDAEEDLEDVVFELDSEAEQEETILDKKRVKEELNFQEQLDLIKTKADELRQRDYIAAADAAADLHFVIIGEYEKLKAGELTSEDFKNNCHHAIERARPELEKHRGWKQILGNLALAVMGVGVLYVFAVLVNKAVTGNFLFFKTDSVNKIEQLEQTIKDLPPTPV